LADEGPDAGDESCDDRTGAVNAASRTERIFAVLGLAYFAKAFLPFISGFEIAEYSMPDAALGNPWDQVIGSTIYVIACASLLHARNPLRVPLVNPVLTLFVLLAIVSTVWSVAPEATLRRAVALLGTTVFGAFLACRFTPREVLTMTAVSLVIALVGSLFVIVFVPSYGMPGDIQFGGVYGHKNDLGRAMLLGALACWAVIQDPMFKWRAWAVGSFIAALVLVVISESVQALLGLIFGFCFVLPLLTLCSRWFTRVDLRLGACLVPIALLIWGIDSSAIEEGLAMLGRDATLTDRTVIWELLVEFIQERPLFGWGYGAFWLSDMAVWFIERWGALDHAHNGYMDLCLELGHVGVGAFVLLILMASLETWKAYLARPSPALAFFPTFIAVAALLNLVARVFPAHNSIFWVLLCYCALISLSAARAEESSQRAIWLTACSTRDPLQIKSADARGEASEEH
jgi:exopolysaccharide production protein ExoQ